MQTCRTGRASCGAPSFTSFHSSSCSRQFRGTAVSCPGPEHLNPEPATDRLELQGSRGLLTMNGQKPPAFQRIRSGSVVALRTSGPPAPAAAAPAAAAAVPAAAALLAATGLPAGLPPLLPALLFREGRSLIQPEIPVRDAFDGAEFFLDLPYFPGVIAGDERECLTGAARPARAADAVRVSVGGRGD